MSTLARHRHASHAHTVLLLLLLRALCLPGRPFPHGATAAIAPWRQPPA